MQILIIHTFQVVNLNRMNKMADFKGRHFSGLVLLWTVRWYFKCSITYRELAEMLEERRISIDDHITLLKYVTEMEKRLRWNWKVE